MLSKLLKYLAFEHGKFIGLYKRVCRPSGYEHAEFLKRRNVLHAIGGGLQFEFGCQYHRPKVCENW